ncbi:hypothetical protein [Pelomonas sp. SE-A7]|uniref:hypothetical protein n=1 Tax=Pelomonas sp. SE-A7 TaxID=3054953 RepID=UPI00259D130A|nr:hypothetical protein [Pelomonas sp. SE-A7]MDM4764958.1 hypothetical protein [Pelomonas sp. SE-A7]
MSTLTLREIPNFPPPWAFASLGGGQERRGRNRMREAFVHLKLACTRIAAEVPGLLGLELQRQVRQACEPIELWMLRGALLQALPPECECAEVYKADIELAMAKAFPRQHA